MCFNNNGVSAHELHRTLGIAYRSAWFMAHHIRCATARPPLLDTLQGIVEVDETYIRGKAKGKRGRGALNMGTPPRDSSANSNAASTAPITWRSDTWTVIWPSSPTATAPPRSRTASEL